MKVALIMATDSCGAIGKGNTIPWKCPEDMKHFVKCTTGRPIIMGRNTWESLGSKPLPKRLNCIISSSMDVGATMQEGMQVFRTLEECLAALTSLRNAWFFDKAMIIGGQQLYQYAIDKDLVDEIICTQLPCTVYEPDAFMPKFSHKLYPAIAGARLPCTVNGEVGEMRLWKYGRIGRWDDSQM